MSMLICHYCKRPIEGETGWGMQENLGAFHMECAEMNGNGLGVLV